MSNQDGRTSASVTLDDGLWAEIDVFCDDRIVGRSKFLELASKRLLATAPKLPEPEEPETVGDPVEPRRVMDRPQA